MSFDFRFPVFGRIMGNDAVVMSRLGVYLGSLEQGA